MDLKKVREHFLEEKEKVKTLKDLENLRQTFLGRKGLVSQLFRELKNVPPEKRKEFGKERNLLRE